MQDHFTHLVYSFILSQLDERGTHGTGSGPHSQCRAALCTTLSMSAHSVGKVSHVVQCQFRLFSLVDDLPHVPLAEVEPLETCGMMEHASHVCHTRNIPFRQVHAALGVLEHTLHIRDSGYIPLAEVALVEPSRIAKHTLHGDNTRSVPSTQVNTANRVCKHALHGRHFGNIPERETFQVEVLDLEAGKHAAHVGESADIPR